MEQIIDLFGHGRNLTILQMSCRGVIVFLIALVLIRISGRRSFGMRTPLDNIIVLLLGAILSRAVVGVSPFWPVVATCFVIVLLHRGLGWLMSHSEFLSKLIEGRKLLLYENGRFIKGNLKRALLCEEEAMQGVRQSALIEDVGKINKIYMEANGEITVIKKTNEP